MLRSSCYSICKASEGNVFVDFELYLLRIVQKVLQRFPLFSKFFLQHFADLFMFESLNNGIDTEGILHVLVTEARDRNLF